MSEHQSDQHYKLQQAVQASQQAMQDLRELGDKVTPEERASFEQKVQQTQQQLQQLTQSEALPGDAFGEQPQRALEAQLRVEQAKQALQGLGSDSDTSASDQDGSL